MNTLHSKIWYAKKWSIDIFIDILGGIFIALGTYNFAAAAEFPMVGVTHPETAAKGTSQAVSPAPSCGRRSSAPSR